MVWLGSIGTLRLVPSTFSTLSTDLDRISSRSRPKLDQYISIRSQPDLYRIWRKSRLNLGRISTRSRPNLDQISTESRKNLDQISSESRPDLDRIRPDVDRMSTRYRPNLKVRYRPDIDQSSIVEICRGYAC